jgi:hypothetical protein
MFASESIVAKLHTVYVSVLVVINIRRIDWSIVVRFVDSDRV